jgi:hypothetical protein
MHIVVVLEEQIFLRVFDNQLSAQGMEDIGELWHYLFPSYHSVVHIVHK